MRTPLSRLAFIAGLALAGAAVAAPTPMASAIEDPVAPPIGAASPAMLAAPVPAISFSSPVRVLGGQFWYGLDMGLDPSGHVHLVASGLHAGKAGLWYATDRSGAWTFKRILAWADGRVWVHPSLAIDTAGRVHIAVEKAGCVECTIAPSKGIWYLSDVGRTRGSFPASPVRLTADGTAQPSLRVAGGHLFLAFAGNPDLAFKAVKLRTNATGGWTTTTIAAKGTEPSLRLGMNGKPRVAYRVAGGLRYAVASKLTGGWTRLDVIGTDAFDLDPRLSIDEQNGAHIAWVDASDAVPVVNHVSRMGGAWSFTMSLGEGTRFALSVDKPTGPWVAIGGDTVRTVTLASGSWQTIPVSPDRGLEVAIKVLDSGKVVLAWTGGDPLGLWIART
jgi:hypothetical protein